MKLDPQGYRVAVVGASSLLGQELLAVLDERRFPVSRLVKYEAEEEPNLPVVDLRENVEAAVPGEDVSEEELDFTFLAARPAAGSSLPAFFRVNGAGLRRANQGAGDKARSMVIDLAESMADRAGGTLSVPFLETGGARTTVQENRLKIFISPHPGAILLSTLLIRLAERFTLERAVAQLFEPVSDIGPRAIDELQKQTINLLTFQKIPRVVFGDQLAFNLLPRLGRAPAGTLAELEKRLRHELREYLSGRAVLPALRVFQVPVFYSLGVSLYLETAKPEPAEAVARALGGGPVQVRRRSQPAPSQVEATGSADILVDTIAPDPEHPAGVWIWAVTDNMRLAAANAVDIAARVANSGKWQVTSSQRE